MPRQTTRSSRNTRQRPRRKPRRRGITYSGQRSTHDTDGLPGYPAVDLFASPGTPFLAPESGRIVRLSGTRGDTSGNVYGQSVYFKGNSGRMYFITHLGTVSDLGHYEKGEVLGTISAWDGGSPHAHVGWNDSGADPGFGDDRSGDDHTHMTTQQTPGQQPSTEPEPLPNAPTSMGLTGVPNAPPLPDLPGSAPSFVPQDPSEAWRFIAAQDLSSPESQKWAERMLRRNA